MNVAFHGKPGTPKWLQYDIGNPSWIDYYWNYDSDTIETLRKEKSLVLIGYSWGGSYIAELTRQLNNINAIIIYEAPLLHGSPTGNAPVLIILNQYNMTPARRKELYKAYSIWSIGREVTELFGQGRHIKRVNDGNRKFGHGWDTNLNDKIENWIDLHAKR